MALVRCSQQPPLASQQMLLQPLAHHSSARHQLFRRGSQQEYRTSNLASRLLASEQVPPSAHLLRELPQFRLSHLERESPPECRLLIRASRPEQQASLRLVPEHSLPPEAQELPQRVHRCLHQILRLESWPGSRPLTVLVQT